MFNNRKYGVVVEGQTMVLEFDGSSPGHDSFEKVINFSIFGFILSYLIKLKHRQYSILLLYEKKFFPSAPLGNQTAALLWKATLSCIVKYITLMCP